MVKSQRSHGDKDELIEEGKRIEINRNVRQNDKNTKSKKIFNTYKKWLK